MDFSYFINDNKSGYKSRENWFKKNHPDEYELIESYSSSFYSDMSFKEKIWFFFMEMKTRPMCVGCGKEMKFTGRFDKPYLDFCSLDCANTNKDELIKRQKDTLMNKYGVDSFFKTEGFYGKIKEIKSTKYGDPNYNNVKKSKQTKLKRYGDPNYNNKEKNKETCLLKYGDEFFSRTKKFNDIIKNNYLKIYNDNNITSVNDKTVDYQCDFCGEITEIKKQLFYERKRDNKTICLKCLPGGLSNKSSYEIDLINYLTDNNIACESGKSIGDSRKEIDVFISNSNLGIEIDGLYWHSELFRDKNYHIDKTNDCLNIGIKLIHIFEDEWLNKKPIVLSILNNRLGLGNNRIYARKCIVRLLNTQETTNFINNNHIQGYAVSSVNIGLEYEGEIVSVMTFGKGRISLNSKKDEWEMVRFANQLNCNVIGGASKLLNFFINEYHPQKIITFSDIRLFDGKLYETLGFTKEHTTKPNYWYVVNNKRLHRFNFRKSKLVLDGYDKNKTEFEIMNERGIYKIYDCGNIKWIKFL